MPPKKSRYSCPSRSRRRMPLPSVEHDRLLVVVGDRREQELLVLAAHLGGRSSRALGRGLRIHRPPIAAPCPGQAGGCRAARLVARTKRPAPRSTSSLPSANAHRPFDDHVAGPPLHLEALEDVAVAAASGGSSRCASPVARRVVDHQVGVGADRDRALARVEPEDARRVACCRAPPCAAGRSGPSQHAVGVEQLQPVLDARRRRSGSS